MEMDLPLSEVLLRVGNDIYGNNELVHSVKVGEGCGRAGEKVLRIHMQ